MLNLVGFFSIPEGGGTKKCLTNTMLELQFCFEVKADFSTILSYAVDSAFFLRFFVVVLGGVVFQFPNNLENNLSKSFRKSFFLTF